MKLSIITPIYNTDEKKFLRMLDSIRSCNKLYNIDYEHIVVDDGSKYEVKRYLRKYKNRYKIISFEENLGQGIARNVGIDCAKGEYILFLDSDDWLNQYAFILINDLIKEQKDLYSFGMLFHFIDSVMYEPVRKNGDFSIICGTALCNKLYKTSFIKQNNIKFPKFKLGHEDDFFLLNIFLKHPTYRCVTDVIYNYDKMNDGSVSSISPQERYRCRNIYLSNIFNENRKEFNNLHNLFSICDYFYNDYVSMITKITTNELLKNFELYQHIYNLSGNKNSYKHVFKSKFNIRMIRFVLLAFKPILYLNKKIRWMFYSN